mgnify:CR=1 FL=1
MVIRCECKEFVQPSWDKCPHCDRPVVEVSY